MYKKYLKYTIFVFLVNFLFILNASADLICQYEYDVDYHSSSIDTDNFKILITINATSPTHVKYEKNSETALIKVGESKTVGDTVDHITITAKKDLKDKVSKFNNCSDSIGFIWDIKNKYLYITSECDGNEDSGKCSMITGNTLTTGNTQTTEKYKKTTINFSTSDGITGILGVNENKNYYLQIDGDSNVFTFPPSDDFSFEYKNIHYTIDPNTKDNIFNYKENSVYLYSDKYSYQAITRCNLSLNNGYGSTNYDVTIDNSKEKLSFLSFKGICSDTGVRKVFQIMGYILFVVKIAIPLCLLIFGIINLVKVVVSGEQEGLAKSFKSLGIKAIAAVVIFILPTIIYYIINLVDGSNEGTEVYGYCKTCIFEPKKC